MQEMVHNRVGDSCIWNDVSQLNSRHNFATTYQWWIAAMHVQLRLLAIRGTNMSILFKCSGYLLTSKMTVMGNITPANALVVLSAFILMSGIFLRRCCYNQIFANIISTDAWVHGFAVMFGRWWWFLVVGAVSPLAAYKSHENCVCRDPFYQHGFILIHV